MFKRVLETIRRHNMFSPGDRVVAGVSGGADSVALLHVLLECAPLCDINVYAVHVNHRIRGAEADRDEQFVRELCEKLGVPLDAYNLDVPRIAKERHMTVEEAGRAVRYECYEQSAARLRASKIAVAHHKNDNAETVLMRLFRGSGLTGLGGIPHVRGKITRPLLDVSRAEIERWCNDNSLGFQTDSTNLNADYTRNCVRINVIPLIEKEINPSVVDAVTRAAALCREDGDYLDALATEAYGACVRPDACEGGAAALYIPIFTTLAPPIQKRVVRIGLTALGAGLHDINEEHVRSAVALAYGASGKNTALPGGVVCEREYRHIVLRKNPVKIEEFCHDVTLGAPIRIPQARKTVLVTNYLQIQDKNICTKAFRCDRIKGRLLVRSFCAGDRISIDRMGGHKKISDYFSDRKIARRERALIPLLADGSDILWIMDDKSIVSDEYKADGRSAGTLYVSVWEDNDER